MVNITDTFSDGFEYAKQDYKKLLIIGVVAVLANLTSLLNVFNLGSTVSLITDLVAFIFTLIFSGFGISVIKENINSSEVIPDFDWALNFTTGIKLFILSLVYFLIPIIIICVVSVFTIDPNVITNITNFISQNPGVVPPETMLTPLLTSLGIIAIVAFILFVIFGLMEVVGMCRLAKYDSLNDGLNFREVINDIRKIGVLSLIGWVILAILIFIVFGIIILILGMIPYIGFLIATLVVVSFSNVFYNASLGRLYSQI